MPWKFEAGTPAIVEAVGFGAAVDYISAFGMDAVRAHEVSLTGYALDSFGQSTLHGRALRLHLPSAKVSPVIGECQFEIPLHC